MVVHTSSKSGFGNRTLDHNSVYLDSAAPDELAYPDGFEYLCGTCKFLAESYGPDDGETISHVGEGKHTYDWLKVGYIRPGAITYSQIDPGAISYYNPTRNHNDKPFPLTGS